MCAHEKKCAVARSKKRILCTCGGVPSLHMGVFQRATQRPQRNVRRVTDETLTVVCSLANERGHTSRSQVTESAHTKLSNTLCSEGNQEFTESRTMPVYVPPVDTIPRARA